MGFLIVAVFLGLIPASIARNKGHSFIVWWLFGAGLFIVALPCAIFLSDERQSVTRGGSVAFGAADVKRCPFCAEIIQAQAIVCRYCNREVAAPMRARMWADAGERPMLTATRTIESEPGTTVKVPAIPIRVLYREAGGRIDDMIGTLDTVQGRYVGDRFDPKNVAVTDKRTGMPTVIYAARITSICLQGSPLNGDVEAFLRVIVREVRNE